MRHALGIADVAMRRRQKRLHGIIGDGAAPGNRLEVMSVIFRRLPATAQRFSGAIPGAGNYALTGNLACGIRGTDSRWTAAVRFGDQGGQLRGALTRVERDVIARRARTLLAQALSAGPAAFP
jgi:hypothetical protein